MNKTFTIKQHATRPPLVAILKQPQVDGEGNIVLVENEPVFVPINLTELKVVEVFFVMRSRSASDPASPKVNALCTITSPTTGKVTYVWETGDTDTVDDYKCEWELILEDGGIQKIPNEDWDTVSVIDDVG